MKYGLLELLFLNFLSSKFKKISRAQYFFQINRFTIFSTHIKSFIRLGIMVYFFIHVLSLNYNSNNYYYHYKKQQFFYVIIL